MSQGMNTPEARTETTTLVVEETTSLIGFQAVAKALGGKKGEATSNKTAGLALGEDSATPFTLEGTFTVGGDSVDISESGHIIVERSFQRPQTTAFPIAPALHLALGVMGAHSPQMLDAVLAGMTASAAGGDALAALEAAGFTLSEKAQARATAHMKELATKSTRTVSAAVKVELD